MAKDRYTYGNHVSLDEACPAIMEILESMQPAVVEGMNEGVTLTTEIGRDYLRMSGDYHNRRPKYRKSLAYRTSTRGPSIQAQLYAKGHEYSLTHLLENGHHLWQAPKKKTRAFPHWKPTEDWINDHIQQIVLARIAMKLNEV